jgi:hypothetical protein
MSNDIDLAIEEIGKSRHLTTYLAGPIGVVPMKGCGEWRDKLTIELKELNIEAFNPLGQFGGDRITKSRKKLKESIKYGDLTWVRKFVSETVIPPDLEDTINCTFLTAYIPIDNGYEICGTYGEITLAHYFKKPIYIITDRKLEPCEVPAWVVGCSTYIFSDFNQYLRFIKAWYVDKIVDTI